MKDASVNLSDNTTVVYFSFTQSPKGGGRRDKIMFTVM